MSPDAVEAASDAPVEGTVDPHDGFAATAVVVGAVFVEGVEVEAFELEPPPDPQPATTAVTRTTATATTDERR
jgi:hypothetical protein